MKTKQLSPLAEHLFFAFAAAALLGACGDETSSTGSTTQDCPDPTTTGGGGEAGTGGGTTTGSTSSSSASTGTAMDTGPGSESGNNEFDHMNDPGESGQKDPYEILKERAEEGPAEIRTRLHGCTKLKYAALGDLLTSRGVNLAATGTPDTAGELYNAGRNALGFAKFDAREAESYFHTTSGATKLFDIFVQASTEIIANIENAEACKLNGVGAPMFEVADGSCNKQALSCLMGRPAKEQDLILCDLIVSQNDGTMADLTRKRQVAVAVFLSAAHTCE